MSLRAVGCECCLIQQSTYLARRQPLGAEDRAGELKDGLPARWGEKGLEAPAWSPLSPDDLDDPETIRLRKEHEAVVARAAAHVGVSPPVTMAELAELMRRLGLIRREVVGLGAYWQISRPLPLPEECFPLTDEERSHEDRIRWQGSTIARPKP